MAKVIRGTQPSLRDLFQDSGVTQHICNAQGDGLGYGNYGNESTHSAGYGSGVPVGRHVNWEGAGSGLYGSGHMRDGSGKGHAEEGYGYDYSGISERYGRSYLDGSGDGAKSVDWESAIKYLTETWSARQRARLAELQKVGCAIAFWCSDENGCAANGGRNSPVYPGCVEKTLGPLRDECGEGQLHATLYPPLWSGDRVWIVALYPPVKGDSIKLWALKREIIGEAL